MELGASAKQDMVAVADEPSEHNHPDLEKQQQQPPPLTTKAADGGCGWWYEYCKAKACSWPGALALVLVLLAGTALLVVWGDYWDYLFFALTLITFCLCTSMIALIIVLPNLDHQDGGTGTGRWRLLVLPWARAVAEQVVAWSIVMFFPLSLVSALSLVFGTMQLLLEDPAVADSAI